VSACISQVTDDVLQKKEEKYDRKRNLKARNSSRMKEKEK